MKLKTLFNSILFTVVISLALTAHAQTFSVIYAFTGGTDGSEPSAGVTIRGDSLYGTTSGPTSGTVYQLTHYGIRSAIHPTCEALSTSGHPWDPELSSDRTAIVQHVR